VTGDGQDEDRKLVDKDQPRLLRLQNACEGAVGFVLPFPGVTIDVDACARDLDTPYPPPVPLEPGRDGIRLECVFRSS
jgi:hypothetical protein